MSLRKLRVVLMRLSFVLLVLLAMFTAPSWSKDSTLSFTTELAGYLFLLAGLGIRMWSTLYIGGRKSQDLVTEGPYSICRNPLYMGTFLLAFGAAFCLENPAMLLATFLLVIPAHVLVARMEERHLESMFPEQYGQYQRQVPAFWPRLRNYHSPETVEVSVRAIRRMAIDTLGFLLIPAAEDVLDVLHNHGVFPILWRFP